LDREKQQDLERIAGMEAVPAILAMVCHTTSMGFAAIASVTEKQWLACATRDEIAFGLLPGGELPLETTICHEIRDHRQPVIIEDVAADPIYCHHHTPALYGLRSYVSFPILLPDGSFFGTLCAIDPQPRKLNTPEVLNTFKLLSDLIAKHLATARQMAVIEDLLLQRDRLIVQLRSARDGALDELRRASAMFDDAPSFMAVLEGPEHIFVSANPAYRALIDQRSVIGRTVAEALPEAAEQGFVALLDRVYAEGEPFSMRGAHFIAATRPGESSTDRFLDFLYQPIKDAGSVTGIFVVGHDVTDRVKQMRRQAALAELGEKLRTMRDPAQITHTAAQIMAEALQATRAGLGTVDPERETVVMHRNWCAQGAGPVEGTFRFRDFGSFIEDLKQRETVIVADVRTDPRTMANAQAMADLGIRVLLNFPVFEQDRFVLVAFVHFDDLRQLSQDDISFVEQVADRTQAALARLKAEERQNTLNHELAHRMKNLLAMVQAITSYTLRHTTSLEEGARTIAARLQTMAQAQDILIATSWKAADIHAVAHTTLAPIRVIAAGSP
jgi:GAF domain-containing protein